MEGSKISSLPFIYGAQYYRAPTPHRRHWKADLSRMAEAGFNSVKFWAQWRWGHRAADRFFFDDLDELMDLAAESELSVTINTIFDVSPSWFLTAYPDSRMIAADGSIVESCAVGCRQIGGYPGPCLNHGPAWEARKHFLEKLVVRYGSHPAMGMWDVWNEPELDLTARTPDVRTLRCYCANCKTEFANWLKQKYGELAILNEVWGRCYEDWREIELPRQRETLIDMVDWRLYHLASVSREARRRIACVKSIDREHPVYLHPVPNTLDPFNAITCADDFQLAAGCDCFGGTINGTPASPMQAVSAAQGRICYNVESHLRAGQMGLLSRSLTLDDFARAFVPQIAMGVKGFLHWQYRCETLGAESPAWGLLEPDGQPGSTHDAAVEFWKILKPVSNRLLDARPEPPQVAIFKSSANEILHFCAHGNLADLKDSIDGFTQLFYDWNVRCCYVNDQIVRSGLPDSIRLLVLPMTWALDQATADALAEWVEHGGVLVCEGLTGCFDLSKGRHSDIIPGLGLNSAFGVRELNGTAMIHLTRGRVQRGGLAGDVAKALSALGPAGTNSEIDLNNAMAFPTPEGAIIHGRRQYAEIRGTACRNLASLPGKGPCFVESTPTHGGKVFYAATQIGWQAGAHSNNQWLERVLLAAKISFPVPGERDLRIGRLLAPDGEVLIVSNTAKVDRRLDCKVAEPMTGLFGGIHLHGPTPAKVELSAGQSELFVPRRWLTATEKRPTLSIGDPIALQGMIHSMAKNANPLSPPIPSRKIKT